MRASARSPWRVHFEKGERSRQRAIVTLTARFYWRCQSPLVLSGFSAGVTSSRSLQCATGSTKAIVYPLFFQGADFSSKQLLKSAPRSDGMSLQGSLQQGLHSLHQWCVVVTIHLEELFAPMHSGQRESGWNGVGLQAAIAT